MQIGLWAIYAIFTGVSIIPVIKLDEVRSNPRYRILWLLSLLVFIWSLLVGLNLVAVDAIIIYYSRLITYPVVFGVSYAIFSIFQVYTEHRTPKWFNYIALAFLAFEFVIALTNTWHLWYIQIPYASSLTNEAYDLASRGWFFFLHTTVCYLLLVVGFFRMLCYLRRPNKHYNDAFPFPMILVSLVVGISLNIVHVFFISFPIDPTYIFVVIVTFMLYTIIYKRDFKVNLVLSSRQILFSKMREMYVITDQNHLIIEYSKNLLKRFSHLNLLEGESIKEFYRKINEDAIVYRDISEIQNETYDPKKVYLHIDQQMYRIDRFRDEGTLILLYDETLTIKMMHEIDVIRSLDQMSGVYNRNFFEEHRLKLEHDYPHLGLIMIDVDGLKLFNDYLGHKSGDQLIMRFAECLLSLQKTYDDTIPVRFGGDEFVVVVKEASHDKLDEIIKLILAGTQSENRLEHISFSYGKAMRKPNEQLHTMLKRADMRLYEMKSNRKDYKNDLIKALIEVTKDCEI